MGMDLEQIGGAAGAGFIASILTLLGYERRLRKLEDGKSDKDDVKDVKEALKAKAEKETVARLFDTVEYIKGRVDKLIDLHIREGER